ncbi:MAG TPA: hypothetical protein VFP84_02000 [Kofleriaceae bacterium]|nr:hypothetical protein [Kofleriaceae bacterium]
MVRFACVLAAALIACGGDDHPPTDAGVDAAAPGPALAAAGELVIVAHQGDELRFMAKDAVPAITQGGVTTVIVTAGTDEAASNADELAQARGLKAAYAFLAGAAPGAWQCGPIDVAGHTVRHCRLAAARLSLVFLDLPIGNHDGSATESLLHLWEARSPMIVPVTDKGQSYTQRALDEVLAQIIVETAPATIRSLELAATHGDDHSDHMLVGAAAWLALAASPIPAAGAPRLLSYRGDNIAGEAANNPAPDRAAQAFGYYAACATGCAPCGQACTADQLAAGDRGLLARAYPIGAATVAAGPFTIGAQCVTFPKAGDNGSLITCVPGQNAFAYDPATLVVAGGPGCVSSVLTGELVGAADCPADARGGHFLYDTEGHLWLGVLPAPAADMSFAHLACVDAVGGRPRGVLCGAPRDVKVSLGAP